MYSCTKERFKSFVRSQWLSLALMCSLIIGVLLGIILRVSREDWTKREIMYVTFIGTLFMNALQCIIIPLIVPGLITAIGQMNKKIGGKIAGYTLIYYTLTTLSAILLGILMAAVIEPGVTDEETEESSYSASQNMTLPDSIMDLFRKAIPKNIIQATIQTPMTVVEFNENNPDHKIGRKETWDFATQHAESTNIIGVITVAIVVGIAVAALGKTQNSVLLDMLEEINSIMMLITKWIIYTSPLCLVFLLAGSILGMDAPEEAVRPMLLYFATVLVGFLIHGVVMLPLYYWIMTRKNPYRFMLNMSNVLIMAFGTASSLATLPLNLEVTEKKNLIDRRVTRFVLPLGATLNMDGGALYQGVAALFVAQYIKFGLSASAYIMIAITGSIAAMGTAGVPQGGLVTMVLVFNAVGIPIENITLILPLDWLLDRFQTSLNLLGDAYGAAIISHISRKELESIEPSSIHKIEEECKSMKTATEQKPSTLESNVIQPNSEVKSQPLK